MRSEKTFRIYLRVAALFLAAFLVAHSTRPAVALLENRKTAGPNDDVSAGLFGASVPTNPISHYFYRGDEPERFRSAGLQFIFTSRNVEDDMPGIEEPRRVPQLTGFLEKKRFFTLTLPDDLARGFPAEAHAVVIRLDPSTKFPQVAFSTHTGGPHCCTITKIATGARAGQWQVIDGEEQDVLGYDFKDLDGDGSSELVSFDRSFAYAFGSYSQSHTPIRISQLRSGKLTDVTTRPTFRREVRAFLRRLEKGADQKSEQWSSNGYLAAWVATKINLGEGQAAWTKMLANFDRSNDWGLSECTVELDTAPCPDDKRIKLTYPEALKRHLIKHGYKMNFDGLKME